MATALFNTTSDKILQGHSANESLPIIIVGAGPVGVHCLLEIHKRLPQQSIKIFGDEAWEPYNRVRLTALLSGEINKNSLDNIGNIPVVEHINCYWNNRIQTINTEENYVVDRDGKQHTYSKLILALGSRPRLPNIKGITLKNVFTFRNLDDTQRLLGRQTRSRCTVIIGGGLLGLEAARAMQRFNTEVTCIEHSTRLMFNQIDNRASDYLIDHLQQLGIKVYTDERVKEIVGDSAVQSVELASGKVINCDTVIVSTGIIPLKELAVQAKIIAPYGIRVNDYLETNIKQIYAIGECAEHYDKVYGIVSPGYEQSSVLAYNIFCDAQNNTVKKPEHALLKGLPSTLPTAARKVQLTLSRFLSGFSKNNQQTDTDIQAQANIQLNYARYKGSTSSTQLKVVNYPVLSIGRVDDQVRKDESYVYEEAEKGIYRKLVIQRGHLKGVIAIGAWSARHRLQEAVEKQRLIWPWQRARFLKSGELWQVDESSSVLEWPANATVCNCTGVTRGTLSKAIASGENTVEKLSQATGASSVCGSCRPLLQMLTQSNEPPPKVAWQKPLWGAALVAALFSIILFLLPAFPYPERVDSNIGAISALWETNFYKQISGFTLLGLSVLILLLSVRKRVTRINWGKYAIWRALHVMIGAFIFIAVFVHTGFHLGAQLNSLLMLSFSGLLLVGALASGVIAQEHRLSRQLASRLRKLSIWTHILLFWPIPALLSFHIIKTYYF
ncbi:MAG TPA: NAD(P)/FAD-dependent oxidoreductase [Thiothrix sp.]|nr:NAD(P)/FAD-dependent oxidoreductase [Thiothrix sp.]